MDIAVVLLSGIAFGMGVTWTVYSARINAMKWGQEMDQKTINRLRDENAQLRDQLLECAHTISDMKYNMLAEREKANGKGEET